MLFDYSYSSRKDKLNSCKKQENTENWSKKTVFQKKDAKMWLNAIQIQK
jgi:hypothetical protein